MKKRKSWVDKWIDAETSHVKKALESASRHFDGNDALTVHTLEAIYGQESNFGRLRRSRNIKGAAGDFQLEKKAATRLGLTVSYKNDERFDINHSAAAAAKYLKMLDNSFVKETSLTKGLATIPISDPIERMKFAIAAYNAGEGRIAAAQQATEKSGGDPSKWKDVEEHLEEAGATEDKAKEIRDYVDNILVYQKEFSEKSNADAKTKFNKLKKVSHLPTGAHWITLDGRHILIKD